LMSDVPLGVFLSGGVDSGTIVALMHELGVAPIRTFTIGFEEKSFSEADTAREVATRYGTEHHELIVRPDAATLLPTLVRHFDEPFADSTAIPVWYVSELARRHVKVVLSGEGGDEMLAGYQTSKTRRLASFYARLPEAIGTRLVPAVVRRHPAPAGPSASDLPRGASAARRGASTCRGPRGSAASPGTSRAISPPRPGSAARACSIPSPSIVWSTSISPAAPTTATPSGRS